ncbi:MAG: hypothetical protein K2M10_02215 [Muribaculaceae bacterium]|nr:hypothetical protein [Muribaculaceae bacterium]
MFLAILLSSCSSLNELNFANRQWQISNHYGQIIDADTTYRMTLGNVLIPEPLTIISSDDSVAKYPGMKKFLQEILHTAHLDGAEILFYTPNMQTMFVKPKNNLPSIRPTSITTPMSDDSPYTLWIYDDDIEKWDRKSSEMYTYTYLNKHKQQLLIVDMFDYGDTPMAQVKILQSANKKTSRMLLPASTRDSFFRYNFETIRHHHIEALAHTIEMRRADAIANYKIGQEQKARNK